MKGIIGLVVVLCIGVFIWNLFVSHEIMRDQGRMLAVAFGIPSSETIQVHVGIPPVVVLVDPPETNDSGVQLWDEWKGQHFQLRDASGERISLLTMGTSTLLLGEKAGGAPEFVLWAEIKKGASYSIDFVPVVRERKCYRYSFTAPLVAERVGRKSFELVAESGR